MSQWSSIKYLFSHYLWKNQSWFLWFFAYTKNIGSAIRSLVLLLPDISEYVKTLKVENGDRDTNNTLMSFHIDDENMTSYYKNIKLIGIRLKLKKKLYILQFH